MRLVIQRLRLRKIYSGTFVKLTPASLKMLQTVEPYVAWGLVYNFLNHIMVMPKTDHNIVHNFSSLFSYIVVFLKLSF